MDNKIVIKPLYKPYDWQVKMTRDFMDSQFNACIVARQQGKSEWLIWALLDFLFNYNKHPNPRALVCGKTSESVFGAFFQRIHVLLEKLPKDIYHKTGTKSGVVLVNIYRAHLGDYAQVVFSGVGNMGALRGATWDAAFLDEMSLYPRDCWNSVLRPAMKVRKAKVFFCGTPLSKQDPLYKSLTMCKDERARGNLNYNFTHLSVYDTGVWSPAEIEEEKRSMERDGEEHLFRQELLCEFGVFDAEESPFNRKVAALEDGRADITKIDQKLMQDKVRVNVVCDVGAKGNFATWFYVESSVDKMPVVIDYKDDWASAKELIKYCARVYNEYQVIRITWPHDIAQPSYVDSGTRLDALNDFIHQEGYSNKIIFNVLPKVGKKEQLWTQGRQKFENVRWDRDSSGVHKGLSKLGQLRFKVDAKTGQVRYGQPLLEGFEHACDAFLYLISDVFFESKDLLTKSHQQLSGLAVGQPTQLRNYRQQGVRRYRW